MVLRCPECGQKVDKTKADTGQLVECPACYCHFSVASDEVEGSADAAPSQDVDFYKKKAVQTNVILDEQALAERAKPRSIHPPAKPTQYVVIMIGLMVAGGAWGFILLDNYLQTTFLSILDINQKRIFAGFFSLVGGVLIWFAAKGQLRWFKLLAVAVALGVPFAVLEKKLIEGDDTPKQTLMFNEEVDLSEREEPLPETIDDYSQNDLEPLNSAAEDVGIQNVLGVWVRGLEEDNIAEMSSFMHRMGQVRQAPVFYPRRGGGLYVLIESRLSFKNMYDLLAPISRINLADAQGRMIDITVREDFFNTPAPKEVLDDPLSEDYVEANYHELQSNDMKRIQAAAERLAEYDPAQVTSSLRSGIVNRFKELISQPWAYNVNYVTALGVALVDWVDKTNKEEFDDAMSHVLLVMGGLNSANPPHEMPAVLMEAVVADKYLDGAPYLVDRWAYNPEQWESLLIAMGASVEESVIMKLSNPAGVDRTLFVSGVRILEQVGTKNALPILNIVVGQEDPHLSNLGKAAIREIEKRSTPQQPPAADGQGLGE